MYKAKKYRGGWAVLDKWNSVVKQDLGPSAAMKIAAGLNMEEIMRNVRPAVLASVAMIALVLAACGENTTPGFDADAGAVSDAGATCPVPSFTTENGVKVFNHTCSDEFTRSRCASMENAISVRLGQVQWWDESSMKEVLTKTSVRLHADKFDVQNADGSFTSVQGLMNGFVEDVSDVPAGCPWKSAYIHELAHTFAWIRNNGDADINHTDLRLWNAVWFENDTHECLDQ